MDKTKQLHKRIDELEQTLRIILCCVLLPKDGPNWGYYEHLFSEAEELLKGKNIDLHVAVKQLLNPEIGESELK